MNKDICCWMIIEFYDRNFSNNEKQVVMEWIKEHYSQNELEDVMRGHWDSIRDDEVICDSKKVFNEILIKIK